MNTPPISDQQSRVPWTRSAFRIKRLVVEKLPGTGADPLGSIGARVSRVFLPVQRQFSRRSEGDDGGDDQQVSQRNHFGEQRLCAQLENTLRILVDG